MQKHKKSADVLQGFYKFFFASFSFAICPKMR